MKFEVLERFFSISLRLGGLAAKFLLIIVLANYFSPEDVGIYGLLVATAGYFVFALGFDFYIYSNREVIASEKEHWLALLRDQCVFYLCTYTALIPFFVGIFYFGLLPSIYAGWFVAIVVLEHFSQETTRLAVAVSKPLLSSVISFVRSGLWVFLFVGGIFFFPDIRSLEVLLAAWVVGGVLASLLSLNILTGLNADKPLAPVNWLWIKSGVIMAFPFFLGTMAFNGIFVFDRYIFKFLSDLEILGAYVLFLGIANALMSFLSAGVFIFYYPRMIAAFKNHDRETFFGVLRSMSLQTTIFVGLFSIVTIGGCQFFLEKLGKPIYLEYAYLLPYLLAAFSLQAISMLPHYALYAARVDKPIIVSQLASLPVFIALVVSMAIGGYEELAVPVSLVLVFLFIFSWKLFFFLKYQGFWFRSEGA